MARRDWFDDDHFEEDIGDEHFGGGADIDGDDKTSKAEAGNDYNGTLNTIHDSVDAMRVVDLRQALKKRKMKSTGSKSVLKDRLLQALLEDVDSQ